MINAKDKVSTLKKSLQDTYTYKEYLKLVEDLLAKDQSTTKDSGVEFVHYSKLGLQRMQRWNKKFQLNAEQEAAVKAYSQKRIWLVITEGWCGDAAHSLPVINKIAEANAHIDLRIVLREENLALMNNFLTNGGKSIPKLISYNPEDETVEGDWGPRPAPAQAIFMEAREHNVDFETYEQQLQGWYNKDKGQTTAQEIIDLLK